MDYSLKIGDIRRFEMGASWVLGAVRDITPDGYILVFDICGSSHRMPFDVVNPVIPKLDALERKDLEDLSNLCESFYANETRYKALEREYNSLSENQGFKRVSLEQDIKSLDKAYDNIAMKFQKLINKLACKYPKEKAYYYSE